MNITGEQSWLGGDYSVSTCKLGHTGMVNSLMWSQAAFPRIPAPPPPHWVTLEDEPSVPASSSRKSWKQTNHVGLWWQSNKTAPLIIKTLEKAWHRIAIQIQSVHEEKLFITMDLKATSVIPWIYIRDWISMTLSTKSFVNLLLLIQL